MTEIQIRKKKQYNFCERCCCCKCFTCCQDDQEDLLFAAGRKQQSQRMISKWKKDATREDLILDPIQILIRLYINENTDIIMDLLYRCRLNPNFTPTNFQRDDLEFYIPQIINYFVFHENLNNLDLRRFLKQASYIDFFFGHLVYFYLKSVSKTIFKKHTEKYEQVEQFLEEIVTELAQEYGERILIASEMIKPRSQIRLNRLQSQLDWEPSQKLIKDYGTEREFDNLDFNTKITPSHIELKNYESIFSVEEQEDDLRVSRIDPKFQLLTNVNFKNKNLISSGFLSIEVFMNDLVIISEQLKYSKPQVAGLQELIRKVNEQLPAAVYIPFFSNSVRNYVVLNIVAKESVVFSTKERAPYYICLELFRPEEEIEQETPMTQKIYKKLRQHNLEKTKIWSYDLKLSQPLTAVNTNPITQIKREGFSRNSQGSGNNNLQLMNNVNMNDTYTQSERTRTIDFGEGQKKKDLQQPLLDNDNQFQNSQKSGSQINLELENTSKVIQVSDNKNTTIQQKISNSQNCSDKNDDEEYQSSNDSNMQHYSNNLKDEEKKYQSEQIEQQTYTPPTESAIRSDQKKANFRSQAETEDRYSSKTQEQIFFKTDKCGKVLPKTKSFTTDQIKQQQQEQTDGKVPGISKFYDSKANEQLEINIEEYEQDLREKRLSKQNQDNQDKGRAKEASFIAEQYILTNIKSKKGIELNDQRDKVQQMSKDFFREDMKDQEERIKKDSIYGHFKSWKLLHMIVKTGDNLKQEQFAIQLINQFQQIFQAEGLNLILRPYEVLSIGPGEGLIEMVKNSCTFDGLHKKLYENYKDIKDLNQFFNIFYGTEHEKARENFCNSLAAYSLVCYFMQIKDRHNGNILLHKDGYMVHIDFGFFLSNTPGGALEQKVPFKMLTEYVEILGGLESDLFQKFRRRFFKGFLACKRHQDKILILAKMLYSGHGSTLPCFEKGDQCLKDLQERFNPPKIQSDQDLYVYTQSLINSSMDNWRARWYDKYQYLCQGIFY